MTYELTSPLGFEVKICSRCCGTGNYSFNQIDGSRCYGCSGSGKKYTARGKATKLFWDSLVSIDPATVKVGDRIANGSAKFTVAEILPDVRVGSILLKDGTEKPIIQHQFRSVSGTVYNAQAGFPVKLIPQGERREQLIAQALAYQDSLTASGKPRKK